VANSYEARQIAGRIGDLLGQIEADRKRVVRYIDAGGSVEHMDFHTLQRFAHDLARIDEEMRQIAMRTSTAQAR